MKTFKATFSTGTITRKSKHEYVSASALINKQTGEIKNPSFSATLEGNPSASWGGMRMTLNTPNWAKSQKNWKEKAIANNEKLDQTWKLEIVTVTEVK